ncbi:MAG TPA: LAGLIDADG family homing endonuclease [Gammaproteobacteria bacterium]|nr:LAGLIDADG family homing endonuclease [Gammaproteobacteria bacterium]
MTLKNEPRNTAVEPEIPLQPALHEIWDSKYRLKDPAGEPVDRDIDATYRRVAKAVADVEATPALRAHWYERFLWALRNGALPAGRILSNAGALDYKPATSTINCTVSATIHDSMDGILGKLHEAGMTLKSGAGIGYEFSTLRPRGAYVSGAGSRTSGPLSFMDIYDRMCFTISSAGGRRGAQMATFDVGHPDVFEFIDAKREAGRLRQFNLSLLITEEFMRAVERNSEWPLSFPLGSGEAAAGNIDVNDSSAVIWRDWPVHEGYIVNGEGKVACRIYRKVPARELWERIMRSTYDYAEPGFILIDRYNEMNNNWFCEHIRATNPCVVADTWVHTAAGPRRVADLTAAPFVARVHGSDYPSMPEGFFKTGNKPVIRLRTLEGYSLRLTSDHPVKKVVRHTRWVVESEWRPAGSLIHGDKITLNDHRGNIEWPGNYSEGEGYLMGLLVGDGTLKQTEAVLSVWTPVASMSADGSVSISGVQAIKDAALMAARKLPHRADFSGWTKVSGRNEFRLTLASLAKLAFRLGMSPGNKTITPSVEQESSDFYRGFLRGLFDSDGSVQGAQRKGVSIRLSQSDRPLLEAAQRMLLRLGIASCIHLNRRREGTKSLPDGKGPLRHYPIKAQHDLIISGENVARFSAVIGFVDSNKNTRLSNLLRNYKRKPNREGFVVTIDRVESDGVEDVYDVQIPGAHSFDANGLYVHNCGEQGLPPYGACLLGSVNLVRFVRRPFTDRAEFDWAEFREAVGVFTRLLDNVVELHGLPLPQQQREILRKRRHGMGFMGLGSALTMLGVAYGSEQSLVFTERVSRELAVEGWRQALELAGEKGPAPILLEDFTVTEEMLARRPEMRRDGWKAGQTVKGRVLHARYSRYMQQLAEIEPDLVAALTEAGARFTHHSSIAPTGTIALSLGNNVSNGIEPSFAHHYTRNVLRAGRKSKQTIDVYSYELLAYRQYVNPRAMPDAMQESARLPACFVTAGDITPQQHVDVQAAAQQWIDSSISKTANVPTDYPYEDFKEIYLYAWRKGLKGCTTFRFNPQAFQGVLVKEQDLANTRYRFTLADGSMIEARGNEEIEYEGEIHTAANLHEALKEGYYGKF